jgi:ubiquinol-cytochrome c reductase cytochrome b subunit
VSLLAPLRRWIEDRADIAATLEPLAKHPVPPNTGWMYVFGSATLMAFVLQVVTGAALATVYVPSAGQAYQSLVFITHQALLGNFLRAMHYFGASAMILLVGMHAIRVFLTGSYRFPRELNWLSGLLLLALTVAMGFTGQVLRWDQDGVWSTVVAAEQAGRVPIIGHALARLVLAGDNIGTATLSHMFTYHVFLIPALIALVIGAHLYLVIRHGISEPPRAGEPVDPATYRAEYADRLRRTGRPFWPYAAWRDVAFGVAVLVGIAACAVIFGPKVLGKPPDPSIIEAYPKPDWYLLWYFAVLALLPHGTERYLIWLLPLLAGLVLVFLPLVFRRGERHPSQRPWAWMAVAAIVIGVAAFWRLGIAAPWSPDFSAPPLPAAVVASTDTLVVRGAQLFHERGCEYCHRIAGYGGRRGPDFTHVGDRLPQPEIAQWIDNGGYNMPAFAEVLSTSQVEALTAFLASRSSASRAADDPSPAAVERR